MAQRHVEAQVKSSTLVQAKGGAFRLRSHFSMDVKTAAVIGDAILVSLTFRGTILLLLIIETPGSKESQASESHG